MDKEVMALGLLARLNEPGIHASPSTRTAALVLCILADDAGFVQMSGKELACRIASSISTARRILQDLRTAGVLHLSRSGRGHKAGALYYLYAVPVTRGSEADPCSK